MNSVIKLKKVHSVLGYIVGNVLCGSGQGNYSPMQLFTVQTTPESTGCHTFKIIKIKGVT